MSKNEKPTEVKSKITELKPSPSKGGWKDAITTHLLLFGFWMTPKEELQSRLKNPSKQSMVMTWVHLIGSLLFISLILLGAFEGPEAVHQMLIGNFRYYTNTLLDWALYTYLLIFVLTLDIAVVLPLILGSFFN